MSRIWRLLPVSVLRSAGFSVDLLDGLAVPPLDALEQAEEALERVVREARRALVAAGDGAWRKRAARSLDESRPLPPFPGGDAPAAARAYGEALEARERARVEAATRFEAGLRGARGALAAVCRREDFRVFLLDSSPTAVAAAERVAALAGEQPTSARRADEDRLCLFLQRACAKNDTASFHGPLTWLWLDPPAARFAVTSSDGWLGRRVVLLEHWAAQALARAVATDPQVAPHLPVRLNAGCRLEGDALWFAAGRRVVLDPAARALVERAVAGATARELAAVDAQRRMPALLERRVLVTGLPLPTVPDSVRALRRALEALPVELEARARWLARLDELEALGATYRDGSLSGRAAARAAAEERLVSWADVTSASRGSGRFFAGRHVLHELCARQLDVALGPVAQEIERAIAPISELARWATVASACAWEAAFAAELAPALRSRGALELQEALRLIGPLTRSEGHGPSPDVPARNLLAAAWSDTLAAHATSDETEEIALADGDLERVAAALPELPERMRPEEILGADFHSPDVLVAAASPEAIAAGAYRLVLGELHAGVFAVASPMYGPLCPWPERVAKVAAGLWPRPLLQLPDSPATYNLGDLLWPETPGLREVVYDGTCPRFGGAVPIAELRVVQEEDRLYVVGRGGERERLLSLYQAFLHRRLFSLPLVPIEGSRTPRVSWGRLVLRRRAWRVDLAELPRVSATAARGLDGFVALRRLRARKGLPERVFARVYGEPKPVLVDFRSPLLLAAWLRLLPTVGEAVFTEVLPDAPECWLSDARGRCVSELRFTLAASA
ncbi:MAG TPA: hypothetical protein VMZ28_12410 [Kofleriaceae bacterium]|nr:hypothetical protein [Kofleriaceae bacterium]